MKFHYTDTELKALLSSLTVVVDTREQENTHITDYFTKHKIPFVSKKLDFGDYSAMIPENHNSGILRDTYFTDSIVVERKNGLTELANNLSNDRARFEQELIRATGCKLFLMVEDGNGYSNILNHKYNSEYNEKSFLATLATYTARHNLNVNFVPQSCAGHFVAHTLVYHVREFLKGNM